MRWFLVAPLLGLASATPCKPKTSTTSDTSAVASSSSTVSSSVTGVASSTLISTAAAQSVSISSSVPTSTFSTTVSGSDSSVSTIIATTTDNAATSTSASTSPSSLNKSASSSTQSSSSSSSSSTSISSQTTSSEASSTQTTSSTIVASSSSTSSSSSSSSSTVSSITVASTSSATSTFVTSTSSAESSTVTDGTTTAAPPTTTSTPTSTSSTSTFNAATASVTNPLALTFYDPNLNDGTNGRDPPSSGYECFAGPSTYFPPIDTWASFETMWTVLSRDEFGLIGDSAAEIADIRASVLAVSQIAKVDPRVILAVITDESSGNVRVGCTSNGVSNCGLMQAYDSSSFDPANPASSIRQMIQDGTQGTQYGPGLVQLLNDATRSGGDLWTALRLYNSGSADLANLSDGRGATPAYVSNIANYLQGWNGYGNDVDNCDFSLPFDTDPED